MSTAGRCWRPIRGAPWVRVCYFETPRKCLPSKFLRIGRMRPWRCRIPRPMLLAGKAGPALCWLPDTSLRLDSNPPMGGCPSQLILRGSESVAARRSPSLWPSCRPDITVPWSVSRKPQVTLSPAARKSTIDLHVAMRLNPPHSDLIPDPLDKIVDFGFGPALDSRQGR